MQKNTRIWLGLLIIITAMLVWTSGAVQANNGEISGTVTNAVGDPLANMEVSIYRQTGSDWQLETYAYTQPDGTYTFPGLAAGTYRLLARDWSGVYAFEYYEDGARLADATDIVLADGTTETVDVTMELAGRIAGTVTGYNGTPVNYALVVVFDATDPSQSPLFLQQLMQGGTYDIGGLRSGDYIVRATGQVNGAYHLEYYQDAYDWADADPVPVTLGYTSSNIDFVLGEPLLGEIAGTVQNPAGAPLDGIEVVLYRNSSQQGWHVADYQNSTGGSYSFTGLQPGTYRLSFKDYTGTTAYEYYDNATTLDAATDIVVQDSPITLPPVTLEWAGHITGTLTDPAGDPLEYSLVFLFAAEAAQGSVLFMTDADDGTYNIGGLPTGNYVVQFTGRQGGDAYSEYYDDAPDFASATPISVTVGMTTTNVNGVLGLPPGGTVTGAITDIYGRSFNFASATAYTFDGSSWVVAGQTDTTYYESSYELPLPPGSYRLEFAGGSFHVPNAVTTEFYDDVPDLAAGTDITVTLDGTVSGIDAALGNWATGNISGTVTAVSGAPLSGIEVYAYGSSGFQLYEHVAVTDASGQYTIDPLWPDAYRVEFFDPQAVYAGEWYDDAPDFPAAAPVLVADTAVSGIDAVLDMAPPGSVPGGIRGQVTDAGGAPLFGIQVNLYDANGTFAGITYSDSAGEYRLRGLDAGSYLLRFSDGDGNYITEWYDDAPDQATATPVTVTTGQISSNIDAVLAGAGKISGTVTNAFGNPFPVGSVSAYTWDGNDWAQVGSTILFRESEYELGGLPPGDYRVGFYGSNLGGNGYFEFYDDVQEIDDGTDVPVIAGQTTAGINAVLGQGPGGGIAGRVTDGGGSGLTGITVRAYDEEMDYPYRETSTDATGAYTLTLLYNGAHYVEFVDESGTYPGEFYADVPDILGATPLPVSGSVITGVDAVLDGANSGPGGGIITGTVVSDADGAPLANVEVSCYDANGSYVRRCESTTAVDGRYTLGGFLPDGNYFIRFETADESYVTEWYDDALRISDAISLPVTVGNVTPNVDALLAPAGAISGTITDPDGDPLTLATVQAYTWDNGEWVQVKGTYLYEESSYVLGGLPAGIYRIGFAGGPLSNPGRYVEYYDDVPQIAQGTDVTVTVGQTTPGISAVLGQSRPGGISGTVTAADGTPQANVRVTLYEDGLWRDEAFTDAGGTYQFGSLFPGTYYVGFAGGSSTFLPEYFDDAPDLNSATAISVTNGMVPNVDAVLAQPGGIAGQVSGPGGQPLDFTQVMLYAWDGASWAETAVTYADPGGAYLLNDLRPGTYRLGFIGYLQQPDGTFAMYQSFYDGAVTVDAADDVLVSDGTVTSGIDAQLGGSRAGGGISGHVHDDAGQALVGVSVTAYWQDGSGAWQELGTVATDGDGAYELAGVVDSRYRICFAMHSAHHQMTCYDNAPNLDTATDVVVHDEQMVTAVDGIVTPVVDAPNFTLYLPVAKK